MVSIIHISIPDFYYVILLVGISWSIKIYSWTPHSFLNFKYILIILTWILEIFIKEVADDLKQVTTLLDRRPSESVRALLEFRYPACLVIFTAKFHCTNQPRKYNFYSAPHLIFSMESSSEVKRSLYVSESNRFYSLPSENWHAQVKGHTAHLVCISKPYKVVCVTQVPNYIASMLPITASLNRNEL